MKAAIDTEPLISGHAIRGVGFYTRNLIEALGEKVDAVDFSKTDLSKYDVAHYTFFDLFTHTLPINKKTRTVVTVHDLIPLIYPDHYPPGVRGLINFWLQKISVSSVDAIITYSETSRKDACRFLGVQPEKIHLIYLAPGNFFKRISTDEQLKVKRKYNLPDKFALYLGDTNYNKNIPVLVRACRLAKIPLVICGKQAKELEAMVNTPTMQGPMDWLRYLAGKPHPQLSHFKIILEEIIKNDDVFRLGFVSDQDLVALFNLASVYIQPSLYEGFGLPVLQAFACETPVVVSKTQALVEIAEGGALIADSKSPEDFADKIREITTNEVLRKQLVETGKVIVKNFSWEKAAKETMAVYEEVARRR